MAWLKGSMAAVASEGKCAFLLLGSVVEIVIFYWTYSMSKCVCACEWFLGIYGTGSLTLRTVRVGQFVSVSALSLKLNSRMDLIWSQLIRKNLQPWKEYKSCHMRSWGCVTLMHSVTSVCQTEPILARIRPFNRPFVSECLLRSDIGWLMG